MKIARKAIDHVLVFITLISLASNAVMVYKLRHASSAPKWPIHDRVGSDFANVVLKNGDVLNFAATKRSTVVYIFSPACHWCAQNTESISHLASSIKSQYDIVGLAISDAGLNDYLKRNPLPFPVYVPSQDSLRQLKMIGTPETVVVDERGKVRRAWGGAYAGKTAAEIAVFFNTKLPELETSNMQGQVR